MADDRSKFFTWFFVLLLFLRHSSTEANAADRKAETAAVEAPRSKRVHLRLTDGREEEEDVQSEGAVGDDVTLRESDVWRKSRGRDEETEDLQHVHPTMIENKT